MWLKPQFIQNADIAAEVQKLEEARDQLEQLEDDEDDGDDPEDSDYDPSDEMEEKAAKKKKMTSINLYIRPNMFSFESSQKLIGVNQRKVLR